MVIISRDYIRHAVKGEHEKAKEAIDIHVGNIRLLKKEYNGK